MQLSAYKLDLDKLKNGFLFNLGTAVFRLRYMGTPEAQKALADIRRDLYGAYSGIEAYNHWPTIYGHWLAEYGVVGWSGTVYGLDDKPIEYSKEQARLIFPQEEFKYSLTDELIQACINWENSREDIAVEDEELIKK